MKPIEIVKRLNESSATEKYWDATEIKRDGFMALLKFNFGYDSKGNNYLVTIDNNEVCRFVGSTDEYAIGEFEKIKKEKESGLVDYDFNNSYGKIVESEEDEEDDKYYAIEDLYNYMIDNGYPTKDEIKSIEKNNEVHLSKSDIDAAIDKALEDTDDEEIIKSLESKKVLKDKNKKVSGPKDDDEVKYKGYYIVYEVEPEYNFRGWKIFEENRRSPGSFMQQWDDAIYKAARSKYAKLVIDKVKEITGSIREYQDLDMAKIVVDAMSGSINKNNYESYLNKLQGK